MIRTLFFIGIPLLTLVLILIEIWPDVAGSPDPDAWIDDLERVRCDGGEPGA